MTSLDIAFVKLHHHDKWVAFEFDNKTTTLHSIIDQVGSGLGIEGVNPDDWQLFQLSNGECQIQIPTHLRDQKHYVLKKKVTPSAPSVISVVSKTLSSLWPVLEPPVARVVNTKELVSKDSADDPRDTNGTSDERDSGYAGQQGSPESQGLCFFFKKNDLTESLYKLFAYFLYSPFTTLFCQLEATQQLPAFHPQIFTSNLL